MKAEVGFEVSLRSNHAESVERVTEALKQEGFGILTRVDIHEAFREKLGIEFRPYSILGACNPPLAHRALSAAPEVGLLLPCNVTVESDERGGALVRIVDPSEMMSVSGFSEDGSVFAVAAEARERLQRVAERLAE